MDFFKKWLDKSSSWKQKIREETVSDRRMILATVLAATFTACASAHTTPQGMPGQQQLRYPRLVVAALDDREAPRVRWYISHMALSEQGNSLLISDEAQTFPLRGGWSCQVGSTSKNLPLYEARQTLCANGESAFEFSVQCEPSQLKDNTQIRFKDAAGRYIDFIDVACELSQ